MRQARRYLCFMEQNDRNSRVKLFWECSQSMVKWMVVNGESLYCLDFKPLVKNSGIYKHVWLKLVKLVTCLLHDNSVLKYWVSFPFLLHVHSHNDATLKHKKYIADAPYIIHRINSLWLALEFLPLNPPMMPHSVKTLKKKKMFFSSLNKRILCLSKSPLAMNSEPWSRFLGLPVHGRRCWMNVLRRWAGGVNRIDPDLVPFL